MDISRWKHFFTRILDPWFQPSWVSPTFQPLGSTGPPFLVIIKFSFALRSSGNNGTKRAQDKSSPPSTRISNHKTVQNGDFPGGLVVKNLPSNAGDAGWIPGQGSKILKCHGAAKAAATESTGPRACTPQLERSPQTTTKT